MEKKITTNDVAMWIGALISLALGVTAFVRVQRTPETLVIDERIGIDVYSGITNTLVKDYNFIQSIDNNVLPNVSFLRFNNGVKLKADTPCTMTFEIEENQSTECSFDTNTFLAKFTGGSSPAVQIGIPSNDPYTVGLNSSGNPSGLFD